MKKMFPVVRFALCLAVSGLAFSACQKKPSEPSAGEPETGPTPPPTPVAATATPAPEAAPAPAATPAPATPPPPQLAPAGVYFLLSAVSVTTDAGIIGLPPGTRVVKQPDGRFLANGHLLALRPDQITNDLRIAAQAASSDRAAQAAIRQTLAPPRVAAVSPVAAASPKRGRNRAKDPAEEANAAKIAELERKRDANNAHMDRLRQEFNRLSNQDPRKSPVAQRITRELDAAEAIDRRLVEQIRLLR